MNCTNHFVINTEAAIYKEGRWLVGVRGKNEGHAAGVLSLIGGTVEHTDPLVDTLESAIAREVQEEIGITVKVVGLVNDTSFVSKKGNHVINIVLLCEVVSGNPEITSPEELESLEWLTSEEITNHVATTKWLCDSIKIAAKLVSERIN